MIIDIVCYRRHGHNEQDQPMFTQPKMYTHIANHKVTKDLYTEQLVAAGSITAEYAQEQDASILGRLEQSFTDALDYEDAPAE